MKNLEENDVIGCTGKYGYANKLAATKVMKERKKNVAIAHLGTYRCPICDKWHIGHNENNNNVETEYKRQQKSYITSHLYDFFDELGD